MDPQRFVISVKTSFLPDAGLHYYAENAASGFMVVDVKDAKIFDTLTFAEDIAALLPQTLYSHLEYVEIKIVEYLEHQSK